MRHRVTVLRPRPAGKASPCGDRGRTPTHGPFSGLYKVRVHAHVNRPGGAEGEQFVRVHSVVSIGVIQLEDEVSLRIEVRVTVAARVKGYGEHHAVGR